MGRSQSTWGKKSKERAAKLNLIIVGWEKEHMQYNIQFVIGQVFDVGESRALALEYPEESSGIGAWRTFVLGASLADAVSRTATAPIDRLKTQLQVSIITDLFNLSLQILLRPLRTSTIRFCHPRILHRCDFSPLYVAL